MAAPKKDNKAEKKTTAIRVLSDHVVIENLKIKNSALAEILKKEKKTEQTSSFTRGDSRLRC